MKVEKRLYTASLDDSFLFENFVMARWEEVTHYPWSQSEKMAFLKMQFRARQASYLKQYPILETHILLVDSEKVGHLMTNSIGKELYIVDIFIIPSYRSKGIGKQLIHDYMGKYDRITLQVYYENEKAKSFYENLGFVLDKEEVPYNRMQWNAAVTAFSGENKRM